MKRKRTLLSAFLLVAVFCLPAAGPAAAADDSTFAARRAAFIARIAAAPARDINDALVWMAAGQAPPLDAFERGFRPMELRQDCADFQLPRVLRFLYQFADSPLAPAGAREGARRVLLDFKYWPDEPGEDSMCTWTENHYILFASGAFLAGQLFPEDRFTNSGRTGREMMARFRPRLMKWLELRYRTGFNEWFSNVYYDEDLAALVALADFSEDAELAARAAMAADLLLADLACNNFRGIPGGTQGRTYERHKKRPGHTSMSAVSHLLFGQGGEGAPMSAVQLALATRYRAPRVLFEIANDTAATLANRQRIGIRIEDGARWGLGYADVESGMHWLTTGAYAHPRTINLFADMLDRFGWWENAFFQPFKPYEALLRRGRDTQVLLPLISYAFLRDLTRNLRTEVNVYTHRTPDYQLSTAQDWRPGFGGDQQHIWQATLGPDAVCFTTHPARRGGPSPDYWTGNGTNPRAAQVDNVALCLYDIRTRPGLYITHDQQFTHAWLPRDAFDEVAERGRWHFARKGEGYLALFSARPGFWQADPAHEADVEREFIVPGRQNVWICELGRAADDGPFAAFVERIAAARVDVDGLSVIYDSPSRGRLEFGWEGPLRQDGAEIPLHDYPRYANPYAEVAFPADRVEFRHGDAWLRLDWDACARDASSWLE
jgi:hypothetical protein